MAIKTHSRSWTLTILIALTLLGTGYYFWQIKGNENTANRYQTQKISRGVIDQSISANGTLNPVVLVNVGTQVSGTVRKLHVDFNDKVTTGEILAELDPSLFQAQVQQSEASLLNAQATLKLAKIKAKQADELVAKNFISKTQRDEAQQALEAAQAQVASSKAQLARDRTNLRNSIIRSPISGVVVARNVDLGQTVAASFQTPTLFQIAKDLTEMQIDTSIAEADIGSIYLGQPVKFTVDTFPNREFEGSVRQIRLNPTIQQNVVTYNVVVGVTNKDGKLLPGMTAHVIITLNHRDDALRIPNTALRFKPGNNGSESPEKHRSKGTTVYKLVDGAAVPVKIKTGVADTTYTEVLSGDLKEGDEIILKDLAAKKEKGASTFRLRMF